MSRGLKFLVIMSVVCLAVMAAGCSDKTVEASANADEDALRAVTEEGDGLVKGANDQSSSKLPLSGMAAEEQRRLKRLGEYKDPYFDTHPVSFRNPDVKIIRQEVVDKRQSPDDPNFGISLLIQNNGPDTMRVPDPMYGRVDKLLRSGDRAWVNGTFGDGSFNNYRRSTMDEYKSEPIWAESMKLNEIPAELPNLDLSQCAFDCNVDSIRYVVTDQARGWAELEVTLSNSGVRDQKFQCSMYGKNEYGQTDSRGSESVNVPVGQSVMVKMPFTESFKAEDVSCLAVHYSQ